MSENVRKMTIDEIINNLKYNPEIDMCINDIMPDLVEMLEKLKEYKELEEQGRLLKLQCNVGTEVFAIFPIGDHYEKCQIKKIEIHSTIIGKIRYFVEPTAHRGCSFSYFDNEFEKYVFLTKEEAEARLKEMETSSIGDE